MIFRCLITDYDKLEKVFCIFDLDLTKKCVIKSPPRKRIFVKDEIIVSKIIFLNHVQFNRFHLRNSTRPLHFFKSSVAIPTDQAQFDLGPMSSDRAQIRLLDRRRWILVFVRHSLSQPIANLL
jgi:hypothetical protein